MKLAALLLLLSVSAFAASPCAKTDATKPYITGFKNDRGVFSVTVDGALLADKNCQLALEVSNGSHFVVGERADIQNKVFSVYAEFYPRNGDVEGATTCMLLIFHKSENHHKSGGKVIGTVNCSLVKQPTPKDGEVLTGTLETVAVGLPLEVSPGSRRVRSLPLD
jgi:hypothetical protein